MDYAILVAVIDRLQDLLDTVRGICFRVEFSGNNVFKQFSSSDPEE